MHKIFSNFAPIFVTLHNNLHCIYIAFTLQVQICEKARKYVIFSPSRIYISFSFGLHWVYIG